MARLSRHAQQRIAERGISAADVEQVLREAHTTYTDQSGNPCHIGHVGGNRIKVVVAADDPNFVITVIKQSEETDGDQG